VSLACMHHTLTTPTCRPAACSRVRRLRHLARCVGLQAVVRREHAAAVLGLLLLYWGKAKLH
jgi:hypothetical protein